MADTSTTKYPIPSSNPDVLEFNAKRIDEFASSDNPSYLDRGGIERKTVAGMNEDSESAINQFNTNGQDAIDQFNSQSDAALANSGYKVVGSFEVGVTITTEVGRSGAVYYAGDPLNNYAKRGMYAWNGTFPKTVTAGTTPFDTPDDQYWSLAATGYVKQSGAIQLFGQTIDADITIPSNQNALSVNPTISDGVTVTVPEGSVWAIVGSQN